MQPYKERFPVGSRVRVNDLADLTAFKRVWKHHHPLSEEQMRFADKVAAIEGVSFYHGGDVLYKLSGIDGIWHEACLQELITVR